ncbi:hypothetical protein F5887DRAFT_1198154 [Amanita rubescens]|nr:hypothetical protein F5887DRAFT_930703 [Amanita rubescens]KAF8313169.1 hypothetical protein F5887DRAFT_930163 [Amanita rubescens]KAF8314114.1 hypothetical protein F5887DRAFT_929853 [Amanita rubescens]KAF8325500.1 hypothetical protein F5887DRAFT_926077 [Amanita rubescens]KAF8325594.1 hypothetical protein F5887DRAFT_926033 [Amanita rubescens]
MRFQPAYRPLLTTCDHAVRVRRPPSTAQSTAHRRTSAHQLSTVHHRRTSTGPPSTAERPPSTTTINFMFGVLISISDASPVHAMRYTNVAKNIRCDANRHTNFPVAPSLPLPTSLKDLLFELFGVLPPAPTVNTFFDPFEAYRIPWTPLLPGPPRAPPALKLSYLPPPVIFECQEPPSLLLAPLPEAITLPLEIPGTLRALPTVVIPVPRHQLCKPFLPPLSLEADELPPGTITTGLTCLHQAFPNHHSQRVCKNKRNPCYFGDRIAYSMPHVQGAFSIWSFGPPSLYKLKITIE